MPFRQTHHAVVFESVRLLGWKVVRNVEYMKGDDDEVEISADTQILDVTEE